MVKGQIAGAFGAPSAALGISPADSHPSTRKPRVQGAPADARRTAQLPLGLDPCGPSASVRNRWYAAPYGGSRQLTEVLADQLPRSCVAHPHRRKTPGPVAILGMLRVTANHNGGVAVHADVQIVDGRRLEFPGLI